MNVSKANFLVSEASILLSEVSILVSVARKLSAGARIFWGPWGPEILVIYINWSSWDFFQKLGDSKVS